MTRQEAIEDAYAYATHKAVEIGSIPSDKRALLTKFAIKFYRNWQKEPGMEWDSLYQVVSGSTVSATDIFTLDTDINFISQSGQRENNYVRIKTTDGQYIPFKTVKPIQLFQYRNVNAVAKIADDQIQFSKAFLADDQAIGGTIEVPAIIKLDDITKDTDEILIDDPEWLPWRMAAQYAYSYPSLRDMYDDLLAQANELMKGMMTNGQVPPSSSTGIDYFATMGNVC